MILLNTLLKLILVLLIVTSLTGCDEDTGLILGIMAVGAASGLSHAIDDDDEQDNPQSDTASNSNASPTTTTDFVIRSRQQYDGISDDLLTAGLGAGGLNNSVPSVTDPSNPTALELRRATIVSQYQALQDQRSSAGYGTLYGPAVPTQLATPSADGKVAGKEYLAYADDGSGQQNVTMMVQIPSNFDPAHPCLVAAPSPGSRSVYGAISTVGEWGLKNHCAVAYTDKGTGNGVHDLNTDTVNLIDGTRAIATEIDKLANFKAQGTTQLDLAGYNSTYPFRIAQKHAHSQQNPQSQWGKNVLTAIQFGFYVLNLEENFGKKTTPTDSDTPANDESPAMITATITTDNTIVIAAGISAGGAAALRAVEQDSHNWVDGVVVAAPLLNVSNFPDAEGIQIQQGNQTFFYPLYNKSLFDVITYYNVFQPCASANTTMGLPGRCTALRNSNWLRSNTLSEQVIEAQKRLNDYGALTSSNAIAHYYEAASLYAGFAYGYASAYGRFSVVDNLCGYSYAGTQGNEPPSGKSLADLADDFQNGSGMPPSSGIQLINNNGNQGSGIDFRQSVDIQGNQESYLAGALCLRQLAIGTTGITTNTGTPLTGNDLENYQKLQEGINETLVSGNLRGKPAIIVHGRDDALAHVNFTSRAYYGLNQQTQGTKSQLSYLEVTNAHHFDAINQQYNINTHIPLYYYFSQSLDRLYDHLKNNTDLPLSQVIPTQPTASLNNRLPAIDSEATCLITFGNRVLTIPEC
jgi:hydroxybutyrate-dimer hydrolase